MTTNTCITGSKAKLWSKILRYMGKSTTLEETGAKNEGHVRKRLWYSPGTPSTLQAQYDTSPYDGLQIGDLCLDTTNNLVYVCTVDCAVATDATWTKISVD